MTIAPDEELWIKFLNDTFRGLQEAARRINSLPSRRSYESRPGWFGKRSKRATGIRYPDETAISQALIGVMDDIRAEQFISAPASNPLQPDLTRLEFHIEVPRRHEPGIGPRSLPTDMQIAIHRDKLDLRIEAKKLLRQGDIGREYLGDRGLGRFDDLNAPYTLERYGAMIAYVFDRDAVSWNETIATGLRGVLATDRVTTTIIAERQVTTSIHVRNVGHPTGGVSECFRTSVLHLVLEFEADPTQRPDRL